MICLKNELTSATSPFQLSLSSLSAQTKVMILEVIQPLKFLIFSVSNSVHLCPAHAGHYVICLSPAIFAKYCVGS